MAHPPMFDDDDPLLARVRRLALALPGAAEKVSHGRPAFCTQKVFAYFGCSTKDDGEWVQHPHHLCVLLEPDERLALLAEGAIQPAYLAPSGWVAVDLDAGDWTRVAELLDASYRVTAPRRLVAELDGES
ncbi:MmcQ/YjbR family DNA-binding protein [Agrococcus sp. DT81.2]|uniref:MmcQ/YjbR family DNA-binding protein n=1 Tax=Agrococcus sp. DT81.2 TaxID=3393414 RepID=UPI003CE59E94